MVKATADLDYLIIDAPGARPGEHAEQLIRESQHIIVPLQPSFFDIDSTRRFLKHLQEIRRIQKGKVKILLLANRIKSPKSNQQDMQSFFQKVGQEPVAWIVERSAYAQQAMQGLAIFDKYQKNLLVLQAQWQPVLDSIIEDPTEWF